MRIQVELKEFESALRAIYDDHLMLEVFINVVRRVRNFAYINAVHLYLDFVGEYSIDRDRLLTFFLAFFEISEANESVL